MTSTPPLIATAMRQTARDFQNIVWPSAKNAELIGGGSLIPVEANEGRNARDELDYIAGIDAWHVTAGNQQMRGLASRVQRVYEPFDNFTIRYSLASGQRTEYAKRLDAIYSEISGGAKWLYPDLTIQAFINIKDDSVFHWGVIRTKDLFLEVERLIESHEIYSPRHPNDYGFREASDGNTFVFISWDYLAQSLNWG